MVVQVLAQLKSLFGDDAAAEGQVQQQLQTSGVQLRSLVSAAPREVSQPCNQLLDVFVLSRTFLLFLSC